MSQWFTFFLFIYCKYKYTSGIRGNFITRFKECKKDGTVVHSHRTKGFQLNSHLNVFAKSTDMPIGYKTYLVFIACFPVPRFTGHFLNQRYSKATQKSVTWS